MVRLRRRESESDAVVDVDWLADAYRRLHGREPTEKQKSAWREKATVTRLDEHREVSDVSP